MLIKLTEADLTNLRTACFTSSMRSDPGWAASLDTIAAKLNDMRDIVVNVLPVLTKVETIMAADRVLRAADDREDTIGASVLELVRETIRNDGV